MKTITLTFIPTNRRGEPHGIDYPCARFLQEHLDKRINKERPALEARVANELADTGSFQVSEEPGADDQISEHEYIRTVVEQMDCDNLLKGQILERF